LETAAEIDDRLDALMSRRRTTTPMLPFERRQDGGVGQHISDGDPACRVERCVERISNQGMASCTMLASSWPMNAPMQTVTTNHG
jgi:hypothetical protein